MDHDLPDREEIACALDVLEVRLARQGQYDQAADVNSAKHLLRAADEEIARLTAERDELKGFVASDARFIREITDANKALHAERDAVQAAMVDGALREAALLARAERAERNVELEAENEALRADVVFSCRRGAWVQSVPSPTVRAVSGRPAPTINLVIPPGDPSDAGTDADILRAVREAREKR